MFSYRLMRFTVNDASQSAARPKPATSRPTFHCGTQFWILTPNREGEGVESDLTPLWLGASRRYAPDPISKKIKIRQKDLFLFSVFSLSFICLFSVFSLSFNWPLNAYEHERAKPQVTAVRDGHTRRRRRGSVRCERNARLERPTGTAMADRSLKL
jgi:hypothetical protein